MLGGHPADRGTERHAGYTRDDLACRGEPTERAGSNAAWQRVTDARTPRHLTVNRSRRKDGGSRLRRWVIPPGRGLPVTGGRPEGGCLTGAPEAEGDRAGAADQRGYSPGDRG